jgi:hypothetical protein
VDAKPEPPWVVRLAVLGSMGTGRGSWDRARRIDRSLDLAVGMLGVVCVSLDAETWVRWVLMQSMGV